MYGSDMREFRNPPTIHAPAAVYSHQVELRDVRMVIMAGQIGMHPDRTLPPDPYEQLQVALDNVAKNLAAADMSIADIVKMKIYLVGEWEPEKRRKTVADFLGDASPTMTVIVAAALGTPDILAEVEVTAAQEI